MPDTVGVQYFPANVEARQSNEELLELVRKKRVYDDAILAEHDPFFWGATISNTRVDSYYTHKMPSSLKNYARDAKDGVPFQDSHMTNGVDRTLGKSLTGEYTPLDENKYASTRADFYTLRGLDPATDSFIAKLRAGLLGDVSVGFMPGRYICNICNRDMLEWNMDNWEDNCWHYPGFRYKKSQDKDAERVLCLAAVEDAHLVEVSTVYAGSTPGAMIDRAQRMLDAGKMPSRMARTIEQHYHVRLLGAREVFLPASLHSEESMDKRQALGDAPVVEDPETPDPVPQPETDPAPTPEPTPEPAPAPTAPSEAERSFDATRALLMSKNLMRSTSLVDSVQALLTELDSLRAKAADGEQYRTDLVDDAITHGTRAFGNGFKVDMYRSMLQGMSIENIRQMRDDWKVLGDKAIPTGRRTVDVPSPIVVPAGDPSLHRA